jgi:ribonuclease HI
MRNFPHVGQHAIEAGDESPEPQVQMQFALYVPKSCPEIILEFPPPWRNLCVSRRGIHYFPAAQCPEPIHLDIHARSPLTVAYSRAHEALRLAEQNRSGELREAQRLEFEADCGVHLDRYRNVSPSSLRYFQEASRHRPLYTAKDPVLSQYRLDAFNAKHDLPPFISWPILLNNSSPFPWCCGACRFKKSAILLPTTALITQSTPPKCPCQIRDAKIVCDACLEVFCWECFTVADDYFLSSLQHTPFPVSVRNYQGASRNFLNAMPACEFDPELAAEANNLELQMAVLAGDADDIDEIRNADKVHSELPSQDLSEEVLLESRRGSSSLAAAALFSCAPTKRTRDGYVVNDFVSAALTPSPPESPSSHSLDDDSDPSYVPSQEGLCPECLQPWPATSATAIRSKPPTPLPLPPFERLVSITAPTAAHSFTIPLPAAGIGLRSPQYTHTNNASVKTFFASLPIVTPAALVAPRTFVPSRSKPLPELPMLTTALTRGNVSTGSAEHNPILVDSPPPDTTLGASLPLAPLSAHALPLAHPFVAPVAVLPPPVFAPPIPPLALAPPAGLPAGVLPPAAPLTGIHPNPGPPPVPLDPSTFTIRANLFYNGIVQGNPLPPRLFVSASSANISAPAVTTSAFDDRFNLACSSPLIGTSLPSCKFSNQSANASRRPIRGNPDPLAPELVAGLPLASPESAAEFPSATSPPSPGAEVQHPVTWLIGGHAQPLPLPTYHLNPAATVSTSVSSLTPVALPPPLDPIEQPPAARLIDIHVNPGPPHRHSPTLAAATSITATPSPFVTYPPTPPLIGIHKNPGPRTTVPANVSAHGSDPTVLGIMDSLLPPAPSNNRARSSSCPLTPGVFLNPLNTNVDTATRITIPAATRSQLLHLAPCALLNTATLSTPAPAPRTSGRLCTPSHHFRNFLPSTLSPLNPLRNLSSLNRACLAPSIDACAIDIANSDPTSPIASSQSQNPCDIRTRNDFDNSVRANYDDLATHSVVEPAPLLDVLVSQEADLLLPLASNTRYRGSLFPLALQLTVPLGPPPPPYLAFNFDCACSTDGGSKDNVGSWAVVVRSVDSTCLLTGPISSPATNNLAELTAILEALRHARRKKFLRVLITSDSEMSVNFLKGLSRIDSPNLFDVTADIRAIIPSFHAVYASHVKAHANISCENAVADALCTWMLSSKHQISNLSLNRNASNLIPLLMSVNAKLTAPVIADTPLVCPCCLKRNEHGIDSCPLVLFTTNFASRQRFTPCPACLSCEHAVTSCPLLATPKRIPCPSLLLAEIPIDVNIFGPMADLTSLNFASMRFPQKQSHQQFLDFWTTVFTKLLTATTEAEAKAAADAAEAWGKHYHIDGIAIHPNRKKSFHSFINREGSNLHPPVADAELELAKRAMRAARLGPDARVSDVSKALRKGQALPLDNRIIAKLALLYPPNNSSPTTFDAPPLESFATNRNSVARAVMSRSPNSHPGKLGISFQVLQLFCLLTFKRETANEPNVRWSIFCNLIAHIMAGKATALSHMFHTVVGIFFDKNFETPGAELSLRNIGVEESLIRIAAALVFSEVITDAKKKGCLSCWELGCGIKNGAEIFGRIAAVAAEKGCVVAVFDVEKAFNNLRRTDIKAAVDNLNNPLLCAFVSYLFAVDPTVTFSDHTREASFSLAQGILQGNPLSTLLFSITICWILKPFRARFPRSLTPSFIDDLQLIGSPTAEYAVMLGEFLALFRSRGLKFDLSNTAKSSVFSVLPLASELLEAISSLDVRTQQRGIAPCKIPFGNPNFIAAHVLKQQTKMILRAKTFGALWPALLKLKPSIRNSRIGVHEGFLNLLRLSLLAMTNYTLRTVSPLFCAPYAGLASTLILELIDLVFPPYLSLIGNPLPFGPATLFPPLMETSRDIMQLPLSLGGLSLRLPAAIYSIAYAASCGECIHYLHAAAARLDFAFDITSLPGLVTARATVTQQLEGYRMRKPDEDIVFERSALSDPAPLQEGLISLFNHAQIVRISAALKCYPAYFFAFMARVDKEQQHCSWPFNPVARRNLNLAALSDEDFSRAVQIATLRPITAPRSCDCGALIDPVGLHFLYCKFVHFGYLHDCVKTALAATIKSFQPLDLAPISVLMEQPVSRFYPLRNLLIPEGTKIVADIVTTICDTAQHVCVIADVSSVLARGPFTSDPRERSPIATPSFHAQLGARSTAKVCKYRKYDIPSHLFHPVTVGRTNVLSRDALIYCNFIGKFFPNIPKASDRLRAAISRAISVGAARTLNTAIKRAQLAAFNGLPFSGVPKSAACALFRPVMLPGNSDVRLRAASFQPDPDAFPPLAAPVSSHTRGKLSALLHTDDDTESTDRPCNILLQGGLNVQSVGVVDR